MGVCVDDECRDGEMGVCEEECRDGGDGCVCGG